MALLLVCVFIWPIASVHPETTTYATSAGQQATVTLSDGTRATLAPNTTFSFVRAGSGARAVDLDGEAYIEVAHASEAPFVVRSNGVTVQVLGTEFLVRHYRDEHRVHVAVANGRVSVRPRAPVADAVTLVAGRIADVFDSTITTTSIDDGTAGAEWVNGRLSFHNRPLPEILATLQRWYGYEFRIADSALARERVTMVLSTHSSATTLSLLELLLNVNVSVVGDTVTLKPQAPRPSRGSPRMHNYDVWTPSREVGR